MIFAVPDYIDVLDYMLSRTEALLELLPESDVEARQMTIFHIAVLKELKSSIEVGAASRLFSVH